MNSAVKNPASVGLDLQVRERQRYRQRQRLLSLPPEMLKDIGISRAEALHEGCKPFWRR